MNITVNFRVSVTIEANTIDEASRKFEDLELGEGIEFVEVLEVHNEDTHEDLTDVF